MNLKPCPFCGAPDPEYIQHPTNGWRHGLGCTNCGCRIGYVTHHDNANWEEELAEKWNDRASAHDPFPGRSTRVIVSLAPNFRDAECCGNCKNFDLIAEEVGGTCKKHISKSFSDTYDYDVRSEMTCDSFESSGKTRIPED